MNLTAQISRSEYSAGLLCTRTALSESAAIGARFGLNNETIPIRRSDNRNCENVVFPTTIRGPYQLGSRVQETSCSENHRSNALHTPSAHPAAPVDSSR